jgi:hypothetical protein
MVSKVGIGITTYLDITNPGFGDAIFDAYLSTSAKITPNQVHVQSQKHPVQSREDFSRLWLTRAAYEVGERRQGTVIDKGEFLIGARWRRTGRLSGLGEVKFRPERDTNGTSSISIVHNYSTGVDWQRLFDELVAISAPSYAMLHLFTEAESARHAHRERFNFDGPVVGEDHFTSWLSSLGHWRRPDRWELKERRQYRYLTELSWANFLGSEFEGQFDPVAIEKVAAKAHFVGKGFVFQITDSLADVERRPSEFDKSRELLRNAFLPGFFRN